MEHVFAILGLSAAVVLWFWLQRATGRAAGGCGACGCGGGSCSKDGAASGDDGTDPVAVDAPAERPHG